MAVGARCFGEDGSVKVDDLREQFKAAFEEYVAYRATMMVGTMANEPNRPKGNMRQCYQHAKDLLQGDMRPTTKYKMVLIRLVRAGDVYLHAKAHGMQSAMMFKLSRE